MDSIDTPFCLTTLHLALGDGLGPAAVTLLSDGELDTLALGEGDPGLVLADDEDVALTGGEAVVEGILDVDDVETTVVALTVGDGTDTTHVTTTGDHGDGAGVELGEVGDLASGEVDLDGVVDLDQGVGEADTAAERLVSKLGSLGITYSRQIKPQSHRLVLSSGANRPKLDPTAE